MLQSKFIYFDEISMNVEVLAYSCISSVCLLSVKPSLIMEGPDLILLDLNNCESNNAAIKEITCKTTAKRLKSVKWKKDNAYITNIINENQIQNLSLKIENANRKHAGRYTCQVETYTGTVLEASKSIGKIHLFL